jgi:Flp pilus assembly protein TadG
MNKSFANAMAGATTVEFALGLLIFLTFFLGIMDFSRMLYMWNVATEATRLGARYAVVCDDTTDKSAVLARMQAMLPQIPDASAIDVAWSPAGCNASSCQGVTVTITKLNYQWISPVAGASAIGAIQMPTFSTYLPREIMRQDSHSSAICQ